MQLNMTRNNMASYCKHFDAVSNFRQFDCVNLFRFLYKTEVTIVKQQIVYICITFLAHAVLLRLN